MLFILITLPTCAPTCALYSSRVTLTDSNVNNLDVFLSFLFPNSTTATALTNITECKFDEVETSAILIVESTEDFNLYVEQQSNQTKWASLLNVVNVYSNNNSTQKEKVAVMCDELLEELSFTANILCSLKSSIPTPTKDKFFQKQQPLGSTNLKESKFMQLRRKSTRSTTFANYKEPIVEAQTSRILIQRTTPPIINSIKRNVKILTRLPTLFKKIDYAHLNRLYKVNRNALYNGGIMRDRFSRIVSGFKQKSPTRAKIPVVEQQDPTTPGTSINKENVGELFALPLSTVVTTVISENPEPLGFVEFVSIFISSNYNNDTVGNSQQYFVSGVDWFWVLVNKAQCIRRYEIFRNFGFFYQIPNPELGQIECWAIIDPNLYPQSARREYKKLESTFHDLNFELCTDYNTFTGHLNTIFFIPKIIASILLNWAACNVYGITPIIDGFLDIVLFGADKCSFSQESFKQNEGWCYFGRSLTIGTPIGVVLLILVIMSVANCGGVFLVLFNTQRNLRYAQILQIIGNSNIKKKKMKRKKTKQQFDEIELKETTEI